jgi:hypothetical protein
VTTRTKLIVYPIFMLLDGWSVMIILGILDIPRGYWVSFAVAMLLNVFLGHPAIRLMEIKDLVK